MRILVDTSIWSLALRRKSDIMNPEAATLRTFIEQGEDSIFSESFSRKCFRA